VPISQRSTLHSPLFSGLRTVSLLTLLSRILGLIRDVGMAALFGGGMVMDAFSVAFRIPNLARRLFGEGALTAAFLPIFVRERKQSGRQAAWQLASAVLGLLAVALCGLVLLGELSLWCLSLVWQSSAEADLLIGLTAVMLPYLILICLAAQVGAILHALGHFTWPALLPVLLNVFWIGAIWWVAPRFESPTAQVYAVAVCILVAGFVQITAPLPTLHRLGFRYDSAWRAAREKVAEIVRVMLPVLVGLSITQLNTISDSLIAWGFSQPESGLAAMSLPGSPHYPLQVGTASALYFGQRMYQFPLGVFGIALGTVLFPQLSRHAADGRLDRLRDDLMLGLRLVVCVGLPASLGLVLLARPLTSLLLEHGAFDAEDAWQTAAMISAYGTAVWAYCGLLIVNRGYYAVGDQQTPLRFGLVTVLLNLVLNLTLIWFLAGPGLALGTAVCAMLQVAATVWFIQRRIGPLDWTQLSRAACRAAVATGVMSLVCYMTLNQIAAEDRLVVRLLRVFVPFAASVVTYLAAAKLLRMDEIWLLLKRNR